MLKDSTTLTNLIFQIQEFEAVGPEFNNLVHTFNAAIYDFEMHIFSLLGGLEPPTFRFSAERASRFRLFYEKSLFLRA